MKRVYFFFSVLLSLLAWSCREVVPIDHSNAAVTLKPQSLSVSKHEIVFNSPAALTTSFWVKSTNVEWEITGIPDWITIKPASGNGDETVTVSVSENTLPTNRVGILSFKSTDNTWSYGQNITVSQYRAKLYARPEKTRIEFDGSASTATIKVDANADGWTVKKNTTLTWCTVEKGDGCINITVVPNVSNTSLECQLTVSTVDGSEYITVVQKPANISSTTDKLEFDVAGGTKTVKINAEAEWTASTSYSWINVTPESGNAGETTLSIQVTANNSLYKRDGYVYLALSYNNRIEIPVSQECISFSIDKTQIDAPVTGHEYQLQLKSNVQWKLLDSIPSWMTLSPKSGTGNSQIDISVTANPSANDRSSKFKIAPVSLTNAATEITVKQNGHTFEADSTALHFSDKAGSAYFNIKSDGSWIVTSSADWIMLDKESGTGDSQIRVSVTENTADSARVGFVNAFVEGKQAKVSIYQQGKYLNISSNALEFISRGGSTQVSIKTNNSWTAKSNDEWINISKTEGDGDCDITITTTDNASVNSRNGYVDITPKESNPIRISVSQSARYLTVSVDTLYFFYKGGTSDPIIINTDGSAEVSTETEWLTINKTAATQFTLTATKNEGEESRTGSVAINLDDLKEGSKSTSIVVRQYSGLSNGHEFVDLGLSVMWASCNIGASRPEEYGDYYAWGELETKGYFSEQTYNKGSKKDVANALWGGRWRMPTPLEINELIENCNWTWTTLNSVKGYLLTSKIEGYTSNSIFLPAGGYRGGWDRDVIGTYGRFWSSSIYGETYGMGLGFFSTSSYGRAFEEQYIGMSVRPVYFPNNRIDDLTIKLDASQLSIDINDTYTLIPSVYVNAQSIDLYNLRWYSNDPSIVSVNQEGLLTGTGIGSAVVSATYMDKIVNCTISVTEPVYEYVDLGLSVLWATHNVGAKTPEGYGNYYAWGEIETKTGYSWNNYKYITEGDADANVKFSKYNSNSSRGVVDNKSVLDEDDDVAHYKWGGNWRMPTKEEFQELVDNCTWTWTTSNNVNGYRVTSNKTGYTDKSIFIPAAGAFYGDEIVNAGARGYYNSSSISPDKVENECEFFISNANHSVSTTGNRSHGHTIRPVAVSQEWLNKLSISLNAGYDTIMIGTSDAIIATVKHDNNVIDKTVEWTSNNPSIATVDNTGVVTGISIGTTIITASCYGKTASITIKVTDRQYVDLGLSVNWATINLGANKPEDYGDYYSWGEIQTKANYTWETYKFGLEKAHTKYCTLSGYGKNGFVDNITELEAEDEAVIQSWGGIWRMPTKEEQEELLANCTWTWTLQNGVKGYKVTSKMTGYTDRSIFLPAAGYRFDTSVYESGTNGHYWSSSLKADSPHQAWRINFDSSVPVEDIRGRNSGRSIRPVCPSETWLSNISISLNQNSQSILIGSTYDLTATVKYKTDVIDQAVTWTTGNPSVAIVDNNGKVTGMSIGSTTVTASCLGKNVTCSITVTAPTPDYVDLGLSVKWATFNIGASKPEEYGCFFAWGETGAKLNYSFENYKYTLSGDNYNNVTFSKYNTHSSRGPVDNKSTLDPEDDAAHVILGGNWRMPTYAEQIELMQNCEWTWTVLNGISGYLLRSIINGNTIFLPASEGCGLYWSSTLDLYGYESEQNKPCKAYNIGFVEENKKWDNTTSRCSNLVIRPVMPLSDDEYEYVDLGLSVNWATSNIGTTLPQGYGSYYSWGELEPKIEYSWTNYKYRSEGDANENVKFSKYNTDINYGAVDNKTTLDVEDDVAHVIWGGIWRMPTYEEQKELVDNCTWTWTTNNGINGYRVTSKIPGYTNKSIFLPAAGCWNNASLDEVGTYSHYWSSSLCGEGTYCAWEIDFNSDHVIMRSDNRVRRSGHSIRPVRTSESWQNSASITLNSNAQSVVIRDMYTLIATVKHGSDVINYDVTWTTADPSVATVSETGVVTGIASGSTTITATCLGKTATCTVTVTIPQPEYIDLGLSVNWATFNVGAHFPDEYGDYFAWGETESKANYAWSTYKYCNGTESGLTKYNGTDKSSLELSDDVAHVKWGGNWRMPTKNEEDELRSNCTWTIVTENGVKGFRVSSNIPGYTEKSIFLPLTGYRDGTTIQRLGSNGLYWSSSLNLSDITRGYDINAVNTGVVLADGNTRSQGVTVRPVCPSNDWLNNVSITFNNSTQSVVIRDTYTLIATVKHGNDVINYDVIWTSTNPSIATVSETGVVTGVAVGSTTIIGTCFGKTATCTITVTPPQPEYVDLGLSANWATFNIGAHFPEEYGDYYSWGETNTKSIYSWSNYIYCVSGDAYSNYVFSKYDGNVMVLDLEDDVARVSWGDNWRMPSREELDELINNCTWTWATLNDVAGYRVTSNINGYTDRNIFLPASGYYDGDRSMNVGASGWYWSASYNNEDPAYAGELFFRSDSKRYAVNPRSVGQSVRPVTSSNTWLNNVSITLNSESQSIFKDNSFTLSATVKHGNDVIDRELVWSSADPSVAMVSETGVVTGVAVGSTTITVTCLGKIATCSVTIKNPEYVDLGLSVKWATCNIGASSPEEYGDYYAWGELATVNQTDMSNINNYNYSGSYVRSYYTWATYKWGDGTPSGSDVIKYSSSDGIINLDLADDVANHIKGGKWRMPTYSEMAELLDNCTWTWTTYNGINGYEVKSNINNNSIFLPAAGAYYNSFLDAPTTTGNYWSSTVDVTSRLYAKIIHFSSNSTNTFEHSLRDIGASVRPVYDNNLVTLEAGYEYVDLGLSVKWASCNIGANAPEESGDCYAWGEIETKDTYVWPTYKYNNTKYNNESIKLTKYCTSASYGYNNFVDNKTVLDSEDDVAHVKWGGSWRIPTYEEINELRNSCTCTWTEENGVEGYLITSNVSGFTDRSIFLPLDSEDSGRFYWLNTLRLVSSGYPGCSWGFDYGTSDFIGLNYKDRYMKAHVRPVCP